MQWSVVPFVCVALPVVSLAAEEPGTQGVPAKLELALEPSGSVGPGVKLDLTARVLGQGGEPLEHFDGEVVLEGIARFRDGKEISVARFRPGGALVLKGVELPRGLLRARLRDAPVSASLERPVLPGFPRLLPPVVAIALALVTRQVLLALFAGVWVGALVQASYQPLTALLRSADRYLVGALGDPSHASILLFSLSLAGMVGIITATGGMRGVVEIFSRYARGRRSGQIATWLLGTLIFFDDYANSLIVGNTMRPFTDRLRISREKLSFIVDATAAPVATIGIISTWTAYQLGVIAEELPNIEGAPRDPYPLFLASIPYNFYSFLMILFVFLVGVTLRDFGAMRRAEERSRTTGALLRPGAQPLVDPSMDRLAPPEDVPPRWVNAAVPLVAVVLFTLVGLWWTGVERLEAEGQLDPSFSDAISNADSYRALLWAALGASLIAGLLALRSGHRLGETISSWFTGARSLVLAAMILVLAWSISAVCKDIHTGGYVYHLTRGILFAEAVPVLAFVLAGTIAFATGTSYGTMGILIPVLLPLGYDLAASGGTDPALTHQIGLATIAAILGGSVFGDHCSPISDTTVLSSMASGADHVDHVRTQLPYAVLAAAVAVPGYVLTGLGVPPLVSLPLSCAALAGIFWAISRRPLEGQTAREE